MVDWQQLIWWIGSIIGIVLGILKIIEVFNNRPKFGLIMKSITCKEFYHGIKSDKTINAAIIFVGKAINDGNQPLTISEVNISTNNFYARNCEDLYKGNPLIDNKLEPKSSREFHLKFQFNHKIGSKSIKGTITFFDTANKEVGKVEFLSEVKAII